MDPTTQTTQGFSQLKISQTFSVLNPRIHKKFQHVLIIIVLILAKWDGMANHPTSSRTFTLLKK